MDAIYVDSSVVIAFLLGDTGASTLKRVRARAVPLLSSSLLQAEVYSALRREGIESVLADTALRLLTWILPDRLLTGELQRVFAVSALRGADAWHLACALRVAPEPEQLAFITLDRTQKAAANALGFRIALR
jgi:predicted nucleic acid-binding protein